MRVTVRAYREVLGVPGALPFAIAGLVGRLPMSMLPLGTVFLVQGQTGSYGVAGSVSAAGALAGAACAPAVGRLMDRHGQSPVLPAVLVVHLVGLGALVAAVETDRPRITWFAASAVVGGAFPQLGSYVRARWAALLAGPHPGLTTAFAVESVLDEVVFVVGPVLVTVVAVTAGPALGLALAGVFALAGGLALAAQRGTDPGPRRVTRGHVPLLGLPVLRVLAATFLAAGAVFSALDVVMVAFARERGVPAAAGPLLALVALGSLVGGLVVGGRPSATAVDRRFRRAVVGFALGMATTVFAPTTPLMAVAAVVAGVSIAPMLIAGFALAERAVPADTLTEGFSWLMTALALGLAVGAPVAGRVVDVADARAGFVVMTGCAALAAASAWAGHRTLRCAG
ncbi:MAG: MFS transporter [Mycobacterium leprae]